jgi:glycerol kinase
MEKDGMRPVNLRVDGGMVVNNWFLQFLSDLLGASVERPQTIETTALGAAYLAGLQAGVYRSLDELSEMWGCDRAFSPQMPKERRDRLYEGWVRVVQKLQHQPNSPG